MGSVKALTDTVRNSMRSGITVYDLSGVVEELVFNSLDANAAKVSVYVDVWNCCVKVVDDGFGVSRDGLGLLGERYVTSKHHTPDGAPVISWSYGFRGEALASISDVSLLEIVTKTRGKPNGYRKIIKASNCLYLGISDDQKDVGTTVIARDVFYNQPVRRKYIQSSPKKVLESIKKCVFQIALVNPKVSFKVVDTYSEDVLLCALPSSTLSRLMNGFGIEDSDSFCEVNASDGALKLSGYVSGPCADFSMKAFQYFYINSRFVCKGPIHKLINNLFTSIEDMHPFKAGSLSGKGKRSRPEMYPAYILNLCCPLSLYDLSFEPSRTNVEFKDWVPILAFIKNAIQQLWSGNELPSHVDHVVQKDGIWDEYKNLDLADNGKHEPEPLKGGIKTNQSSYHLASSSLEILKKEINDIFNGDYDTVPCNEYYMNDSKGEQQASEDIVFGDSRSMCSENVFFSQQTAKLSERSENASFTSDHNFRWQTDYLLEDRFMSRERSSCNVKNHILGLNWQDEPSELEFGERNQCNRNQISLDCLGIDSVLSANEDHGNPVLRSCISRRSLLVDGAVFDSEERFGFAIDNLRSKRRRLDGDENIDIPEVEVSDQRVDVFPSTSHQNEGQDTKLFPPGLAFDLLAGGSTMSFSPRENSLAEEHYFECGSVGRTESFSLGQFLHSGSSATSNAVFTAKDWDIVHFPDDDNAREESSRLEKRENLWDFTVGEEMRGKSSYDVKSKKYRQDNHLISPRSSMLDFNSRSDSFSDFRKFFEENIGTPVQHTGEENWFSVNFLSEMHKNNEPYKVQGDQLGYRNWDQNHFLRKRSIRSHSAPPFYKCKKKIVSLNCHLMQKEGKSQVQLCSGGNSTETVKMKHQNVLPKCTKSDAVKEPDIMLDNKIQKAQNFEHSESMVSQDTLAKERAAASVDHGSKWRENYQRIAKSHVSSARCQNDVLNINSGFLYLAGNSLVPESLHKSCLVDAKVLLQVDKKFIPIVADGTLAVIDQHAADERIRLEDLRQKVLSGKAKTVSYLDAEKELILPEAGYQLLHSYAEQSREWGWICNIHTQSSGTFEKNLNVLHQQSKTVTLLAVPCILGVNLSDGDLLEFLQQLADTDGSSTMPPSVLRVLNYKACRGAIMFGDSLLHSECSLIVEELKKTSFCFQCAHGRPTTVPLVNLEALHKQIAKLGVVKDDSWHRLRRQEISIERASKRLSAATS